MLLLIVVSLLPLQKATALRRGRELEGQLDAALADAARQRQLLERHPADEAAAAGLPAGQPASDVTFQLATLQQQLESLVQERSLAHLQQEQAARQQLEKDKARGHVSGMGGGGRLC